MKEEVRVTPSELYGHFGDNLGKVRWGDKSLLVQKRGRPLAQVISAEGVAPGMDGNRRFPSPEYKRVTPGQFRSQMTEYLARVRIGNQRFLITYRGKVVAIIRPVPRFPR